jgi:hypothetical protein
MQPVDQSRKIFAQLASVLACVFLTGHTFSAAAQPVIQDEDAEQIVIPLSEPSEPAVLDIQLFHGGVRVMGYEGSEIIIEAQRPGSIESSRAPDTEGLRRIGNSSMGLTAEEQGNVVSIRAGGFLPTNLRIMVPRRTSVRASTVNGTEMTIENVSGDHEISNVNGGITASDIAGTVIANATNGSVTISFTQVTPDSAMSFTTLNGFVDVTLPAETDADLRISANRGEILTDFDVEVQPSQVRVDREDDGGRVRVTVNQDVRATLGDGGPEYRFRTFNGDIVIRSRD